MNFLFHNTAKKFSNIAKVQQHCSNSRFNGSWHRPTVSSFKTKNYYRKRDELQEILSHKIAASQSRVPQRVQTYSPVKCQMLHGTLPQMFASKRVWQSEAVVRLSLKAHKHDNTVRFPEKIFQRRVWNHSHISKLLSRTESS